jgi:transcriptional regulator with XRE-family HTH domain
VRENTEPQSFGALLRRYRVAAGLSQEALAERAGLSARGLSDLERGARRLPYRDTVQRLALALGLKQDERAALVDASRRVRAAPAWEHREAKRWLPVPLTSFVGRHDEIAEARHLLETTRLLTLTGAGGIGKTRLALEVAQELAEAYTDGVTLAEFAPLADPALVLQVVASALDIQEQPGRPLRQTLADALRSRQLLLVLDNCEHLVHACADLAEMLLQACPGVRILATSREPLHTGPPHCRSAAALSFSMSIEHWASGGLVHHEGLGRPIIMTD